MSVILGIDTSNYTTSVAIADENGILRNEKIVLDVPLGGRGLRQSDAVFAHTRNLPILMERIGKIAIDAKYILSWIRQKSCKSCIQPATAFIRSLEICIAYRCSITIATAYIHTVGLVKSYGNGERILFE